MARKIISKGSSAPKRQSNSKGGSSASHTGDPHRQNDISTNCQHTNHQRNLEFTRRPFKSETNLFSSPGNACLHSAGNRNFSPDPHCQSSVVNANNGFIPISNSDGRENSAAYDDEIKTNGGSEVTMFKTKVLYHSRSDFRPIGLTGNQSNLTESTEREANV